MLKTLTTFSSEIEAEILKSKLESAGIESFIFKDDCGGMRPHLQLTDGVRLKVSDVDLETAQNIMQLERDKEQLTQEENIDSDKNISILLHRARGWILVGFAIIPGWISFPISFIYATKALRNYNKYSIEDNILRNKIIRLQITSAFFTVLFWMVTILYISI